jgi:hypothetical protein
MSTIPKLRLPDSSELEALRALCRYETHGGYIWAAVMSDGELMCVPCLLENYRQVFRATRDHASTGWALDGYTNSGNSDAAESCCNCNAELWGEQS